MILIILSSFVTYFGGPAQPYSDCCAYVNDVWPPVSGDGVIDLRDFAVIQNGWSCSGDYCGYERPQ